VETLPKSGRERRDPRERFEWQGELEASLRTEGAAPERGQEPEREGAPPRSAEIRIFESARVSVIFVRTLAASFELVIR
jgi:plasmid stabilization system protein ParE